MGSEKFFMLAKTFSGLEDVLKEELIEIGATDITVIPNSVKFSGTNELLYKANFCCRTALRVLKIIGEFKVKGSNDIYNNVRTIDWSSLFDLQQTFTVISTVDSGASNNSMFVSLKTKDAIIDQFKAKLGKRPSVNSETPDIRINVHASADEMTISIDSSGESMHKRGYRMGQNETSISDALAAGILKLAGWKGQSDLWDPMCGSGAIAIEAELIARNIPPGIFRKSFDFEKWKDFDEELFDSVYNADYEIPFEHTIYASDISSVNVKMATENARNAGLKKSIQFSVSDFSSIKPEKNSGLLIVTPPNTQRKNDRLTESLFTMIGDNLKRNFKGFNAWIFSNSEEGFKSIGLRSSQKFAIHNGPVVCDLRNFELYGGSRKQEKQSFVKRPASPNYKEKPDLIDRHQQFEKKFGNREMPRDVKKPEQNPDGSPNRKRKRI
jgi:putative N6-adenine-specific DNA methylase